MKEESDETKVAETSESLEQLVEEEIGLNDQNIEKYVSDFTAQYRQEKVFRELVHQYLNLNFWNRLGLKMGSVFRKSWYEQKTTQLIQNYGHKVLEDTKKAKAIQSDLEQISLLASKLEEQANEVKRVEAKKEQAQQEYQKVNQEKLEATQEINVEYQEKEKIVKRAAAQAEQQIKLRTDATEIVQGKVREYILNSGLVKIDPEGKLTFDEENMMKALEDRLLNETIENIEREDGKGGFLARTKELYDGTIAYFAEMASYDHIHSVEWIQTIIHSHQQGQKVPLLPHHFIYAVPGTAEAKGKTSINTGIIIDRSGSMIENDRWSVAKQTGFSSRALMRRLNQSNETYLAVYNNKVTPVTSLELKKIVPDGGTATHEAIYWLIDTLKEKGPGLAYLITDGLPNSINDAVKAAEKFKEYPYLYLRIFLVDGNAESNQVVRQIGMAAGKDTKVMTINNYRLQQGMIRNLQESIGDLQSITEF